MLRCHECQTANLDMSRFCDECGTRLIRASADGGEADYVPPTVEHPMPEAMDVAPLQAERLEKTPADETFQHSTKPAHATLVIERGGIPGTEFQLTGEEATIGRWDADNGVFPDIDLDAHDEDAKVSRRHARIRRNNGSYFIEDLGSTNGTYVNRGRRLLPGNTQILNDGDEVIVGKTFLRFLVNH